MEERMGMYNSKEEDEMKIVCIMMKWFSCSPFVLCFVWLT
jgi:hypothetical protein